jgi:hypothetical protein
MTVDPSAASPFLIGAGEGLMISAINGTITDYLFFAMCTYAAGFIGALNYAVHVARDRTEVNRASLAVLGNHPRTASYLVATGFVFIASAWGYSVSGYPQPHSAVGVVDRAANVGLPREQSLAVDSTDAWLAKPAEELTDVFDEQVGRVVSA